MSVFHPSFCTKSPKSYQLIVKSSMLSFHINYSDVFNQRCFPLHSLSVLFLIFLIIAIAGTWVVAAIYVRHHEKSLWQYLFAGACILQVKTHDCAFMVGQNKLRKLNCAKSDSLLTPFILF